VTELLKVVTETPFNAETLLAGQSGPITPRARLF
jgi:hypothetical protein